MGHELGISTGRLERFGDPRRHWNASASDQVGDFLSFRFLRNGANFQTGGHDFQSSPSRWTGGRFRHDPSPKFQPLQSNKFFQMLFVVYYY